MELSVFCMWNQFW